MRDTIDSRTGRSPPVSKELNMIRFDRFTERAQDAATRAYEILQRYGHNQVDTEHILLALLDPRIRFN